MNTSVMNKRREFSNDEFMKISRAFEGQYTVFNKLWELGKPTFDPTQDTAYVSFEGKSNTPLRFGINPDFWDSCSDAKKTFVVAHECMHVMLYHGHRMSHFKRSDRGTVIKAMDLVINHRLLGMFGFSQNEIDPEGKYCWDNTLFPDDDVHYDPKKSFEYYFDLLKEKSEDEPDDGEDDSQGDSGNSDGSNEDDQEESDDSDESNSEDSKGSEDHKGLESLEGFPYDALKDALEEAQEEVQDDVKEMVEEAAKEVGVEAGSEWFQIEKKPYVPPPKPKWESVIKKWTRWTETVKSEESWVFKNRRVNLLGSDLMIPSEYEMDLFDKNKINVWLYLDTSGSCVSLAERFWKAALSLPNSRFNTRLFCFDTKVYEVDKKDRKLFGFGGTSFRCIEDDIQKRMAEEGVSYPDAIWIISDGYGNRVLPEKPKRWFMFLTSNGSEKYVPEGGRHFRLEDFE